MDNSLWTNYGGHIPVLLDEVIAALSPVDRAVYLDGTFGAGGYARAIAAAADNRVIGIERDPDACRKAQSWLGQTPSITLLSGCFGDMDTLLSAHGIETGADGLLDGIVLDLGISSMQMDDGSRGFSIQNPGPLDMRMSRDGVSAADLVNEMDEGELADLIYRYGDERASRRIARAIVRARQAARIVDTSTLARIVGSVVRPSGKTHPATRTFQALRIATNDELGELERGLAVAERLLKDGGRLVVVTFHSGEDRIVKQFLDARAKAPPRPSRHLPIDTGVPFGSPSFRLSFKRAVKPSDDEVAQNPRARSAKLRAAIRQRRHQAGRVDPVDEERIAA